MASHRIRLIATGGTFDKRYQPADGSLDFEATCLPDLLRAGRVQAPVTDLLRVDSLDMTQAQREQIVTACRQASENAIVITHGTDTMVETARVLAGAGLAKTIVITGAMVPVAITGSDGVFNLGFAMGAASALPVGVWVAMNGIARPWDDVRKDHENGVFRSAQ